MFKTDQERNSWLLSVVTVLVVLIITIGCVKGCAIETAAKHGYYQSAGR
jgi:hypothetical protein